MKFIALLLTVFLLAGGIGAFGQDAEERIIVAFGDSTTAKRDKLHIYVDILREKLPNTRIINAGVGGNQTRQARTRLHRDVLVHKPDVVIIQFGINDSMTDVWRDPPATTPRMDLANYNGNIRFFIKKVRAIGAQPILMTPNPLGWTAKLKELYGKPPYDPDDPGGFNVILQHYAEMIRTIAEEEKVPLIDIYRAMEGKTDLYLLDGMHPNDRGHRLVANRLLAELKKSHP